MHHEAYENDGEIRSQRRQRSQKTESSRAGPAVEGISVLDSHCTGLFLAVVQLLVQKFYEPAIMMEQLSI